MFKEGAFSDKRVLVTGATRGLGLAIARGFAELGARVALNYASDEKAAARARSELDRLAPETLLLKGDVSSRAHVEEMVGTMLDQWGHIDVLVNNAGVVRDRLLMFLDE
ncbi:MAG: beta-ketoacyl-ACP reductase, partial [Deltaproteobacteria bacterium]